MEKENSLSDLYIKNVCRYFNDNKVLLALHKQYQEEMKCYTSDKFNVFKYIYLDEDFISDIIADILRPDGEHGQGFLFLDKLLSMIDLPPRHEITLVETQVRTRQHIKSLRKMDILIDWMDYGIMIENKPKANDQPNQLINYAEDLKNRYGKDKFKIIYLSGDGKFPSEGSIIKEQREKLESSNQFYHFTYRIQFTKWINECIYSSKSEKYKWYLNDFLNKLNNDYL